jgi:SAM-dependent methyltransferase
MFELDPEIRAFYELGKEAARLSNNVSPSGPLKLVRAQELILRHLPPGPLQVLDVGGGPGVYSKWLIQLGHDVSLIDPVQLHIDQAMLNGVTAELGDARQIERASGTVDAVLLLGPLYHLVERDDRLRALGECLRVLKNGGVIFAAAISRFAALLDLLVRLDRLHEEAIQDAVTSSLASGTFGGGPSGLFTTAYLHRPGELRLEAEQAGISDVRIYNIEGPGFMVHDFAERWADPARKHALLTAAQLVEEDDDMLAAASHLLLVGRKELDELV